MKKFLLLGLILSTALSLGATLQEPALGELALNAASLGVSSVHPETVGVSSYGAESAQTERPDTTATLANSETIHHLEDLYVVAQKASVASEQLRLVTVISQKDIEALPVQSISDLLNYLPGVDIRTRGGNGVQVDVSMRGGTFDQVLILLNGVNMTDPQTGHLSMDLPIDLADVSRIEVLEGTSMTIFGLSGFSGAINIVTGGKKESGVRVSLAAGDHGFYAPSISGHYVGEKWNLNASYSHNESSGYLYNTDYTYDNVFAQASFHDKYLGEFEYQIGGQYKAFGANSFYTLAFPDQFEATRTLLNSLSWHKKIHKFGLNASAYYRAHQDRFELFRSSTVKEVPSWYTQHNHHLSQVGGVNFSADYYSRLGKTSAGIECRDENILSNVLGEDLAITRDVPFEDDSVQFTKSKNRVNLNYFVQQALYYNHWSSSLGVSGNYSSIFGHNMAFGVNLGYKLGAMRVYANVDRSLRLPTFTDLYYHGATQIANPNLKAEEAMNYSLGFKWQNDPWTIGLTTYYRAGKNIIDWIKLPEDDKWHSTNHGEVNAYGGEFQASYRPNTWLRVVEMSYSYNKLDLPNDEYMSQYALDYLAHKAALKVEHKIYGALSATWQLTYQDRSGVYVNKAGVTTDYDPFALLDGRINWKLKGVSIYVGATNILNKSYNDFGGIEQPGRWLKTGLTILL